MQIPNIRYIRISTLLTIAALYLQACKKQLMIDAPVYTKNEVIIYQTDATAATVLAGIYTQMSVSNLWTLSVYPGLSADELKPYSGIPNLITATAYYKNALTVSNTGDIDYWTILYPIIYFANSAIEGLEKSTKLTPTVKKQLLGEAKFIRAYSYFYLVNLYGDVPLATTTNYEVNRLLARTPKDDVWKQIITDLINAKDLLSDNYLDGTVRQPTEERVRPTKWAAIAMLARAYLYIKDYPNAELQSGLVIDHSELFNLSTLNDAFVKNNSEAIWQLQPVSVGQNTFDARWFIIPSTGFNGNHPLHLSDLLLNQFEAGDNRKTEWINSVVIDGTTYYYPYKYKISIADQPVTEYTMVLRLAEQYLIRSEAKIRQNKVTNGIEDLNVLRSRARAEATTNVPNPLPNIPETLSVDQALNAVYHERQVELFTEWGHRWLDLKRTDLVNDVMGSITSQKGGTWNSNWVYYPIPLTDLQRDRHLTQNEGYN